MTHLGCEAGSHLGEHQDMFGGYSGIHHPEEVGRDGEKSLWEVDRDLWRVINIEVENLHGAGHARMIRHTCGKTRLVTNNQIRSANERSPRNTPEKHEIQER